ncbi:MAG: NAD-dependent malic enzyme [Phycisphaerae bacterium]|nr:NAD-dependent malic enzyme [Phycisphaerae bacterium]MBM90230.1 NAD-dependent malic enzyme [Phycisphaerae bacterium]
MSDAYEQSVELHRQHQGKIEIKSKVPLDTREDLSRAYTPGVARPCERIHADVNESFDLTMRGNSVCVLTDGTAVLGLGNIGPAAAMPVMEGKACLFKAFANIDAIPLCVQVPEGDAGTQQLIEIAKAIAPSYSGINLEDIAAPRCFAVEDALQDIGIPVMHDDQHGTAIVLLAAMINAMRVVGKEFTDARVVINGAGAAGTAIAKLLRCVDHESDVCVSVKEVIMCDSKGIIGPDRTDLNDEKKALLAFTNRPGISGTVHDAIKDADVFIGVSVGNLLCADDVRRMNNDAIILAMANPIPEITPDEARKGGAAVIGTGRSDFPNQVNNVLAFPGIFRGAIDARATRINGRMKLAAVHALANAVQNPSPDQILPDPLDHSIAPLVAKAVEQAAIESGLSRVATV